MTLRKSIPLPRFEDEGVVQIPTFEHARNRLKVMAKIDHVRRSLGPIAGVVQLVFSKELDGGAYAQQKCTLNLIFEDEGEDPSVKLRLEFGETTTETGVLWN